MSAKTAALALQELKEAGLLTSDHLCIRVYAVSGDIGKLKIDIQNGHGPLSPNGKEEKRYLEIVEHLDSEEIVALGALLKEHYTKSI